MTQVEITKAIELLAKVVDRAARPIATSAEAVQTRAVPAALIDQISEFLATPGRIAGVVSRETKGA